MVVHSYRKRAFSKVEKDLGKQRQYHAMTSNVLNLTSIILGLLCSVPWNYIVGILGNEKKSSCAIKKCMVKFYSLAKTS